MRAIDKLRETYHHSRYKKVKNLLKRGNLLDIGCGKPCPSMEDGSFIKYIGHGTGLDTKDCSGFDFKKGSVTNMPFKEKSFDNIVAMELLEHIKDVDLVIKNVNRVLKDDGVFIITTPNNSILWKLIWNIWEVTFGKMWHHTHVTNFNKKEWLDLLGKYFKIIKVQNHLGVLLVAKMKKP